MKYAWYMVGLIVSSALPGTRADAPPLLEPLPGIFAPDTGAPRYRLHPAVQDPAAPLLYGTTMTIPLPDRMDVTVALALHDRQPDGTTLLAGRAGTSGDLNLTLATVGEAVDGLLNLAADGVYTFRGTVDALDLAPLNPALLKPCGGGLPGRPDAAERITSASAEPVPLPASVAGMVTVDVAVVYSPLARQSAGGTGPMQAAIAQAVLQANTVFSNSQALVSYRLVYNGEVAYPETGDMFVDLDRLTNTGDGYLDDVHCLRDRYGADLVSLIVEDAQYGGLAWILCNPAFSQPHLGFSVVARSGLPYYTLAHEFGHNFGCDHDRQNPSSCRAHSYSYGYRFTNGPNLNKTVMAYDPGFTVGHFSNPGVSFFGTVTGVATSSPQSAHNVATVNATAGLIANYRPRVTNPGLLPPPAPGSVTAMALHTNRVRVAWSAACEATGYIIRRGGTMIGTSSGLTYEDGGVSAGVAYCYTVIATNAAGTSSASSSTCLTLPLTPPFVLDGVADHPGYLLSSPGMTLYAATRGDQFYVATWSSGNYPGDLDRNDHFIFVSDQLLGAATAPAPWAKAGQVAVPSTKPYLAAESTSDYIAWFNTAGASSAIKTSDNAGQMEGTFNYVQTFGGTPAVVYLATAAYNTRDGGALVAQAPSGSGPNLDPGEFLALPFVVLSDRDSSGIYDVLDPQKDFIAHAVEGNSGGPVTLTWPVFPGKAYVVERAVSPLSDWTIRFTNNATALQTSASWTDPAPLAPAAMYRIQHLP